MIAGEGRGSPDRASSPPPTNPRPQPEKQRPRLLFFYSRTSGLSRRVDAYLAQVLQRHGNHKTFQLIRIAVEQHADLAERFRISELPTLVVIDDRKVRARLEAPRGRQSIEDTLSPWLQ